MNKKYHITEQQLKEASKVSFSIADILRYLKLEFTGGIHKEIKKSIQNYSIDVTHFTGARWNKGKNKTTHPDLIRGMSATEMFVENSTCTTSCIRKYLQQEKDYKHQCVSCNNTHWLGHPIPLDLDHINGNNRDNRRENLRWLCPTCHALTPTYKGKNINKIKKTISDEELRIALEKTPNIRQALIKLGLTSSGGNYARAYEMQLKIKNT